MNKMFLAIIMISSCLYVEAQEGPLMMVVGGYFYDGVEVISPGGNCSIALAAFPYGTIHLGAGAAMAPDGIPLVCGGCVGTPADCSYSDKCYRYIPEADTWEETGSMSGKKRGQAADYTDSLGLAMAYFDAPLEVTRDGVDFEILADYPNGEEVFGSDSGCLVAIDDRNLFLAGGNSGAPGSNRAFMYSLDEDSWRELPSMGAGRRYHSCGLIEAGEGGKEIVVAGGEFDSSVEIFTVEEESWRRGNDLPFGLDSAYSVRYQDSFALVGGFDYDSGERLDTLLKYEPQSDSWTELPGKMQVARRYPVAIAVDESLFPECAKMRE